MYILGQKSSLQEVKILKSLIANFSIVSDFSTMNILFIRSKSYSKLILKVLKKFKTFAKNQNYSNKNEMHPYIFSNFTSKYVK